MIILIYILLGLAGLVFIGLLVFVLSWLQMGAWIGRFERHFHNNFIKNQKHDNEEKK